MAASYPGAVKTFATRSAGQVIDASHVNDLQDEVNAIEAGLLNGTAPLNSSNSTVANLSVTGNSTLTVNVSIGQHLQVSGNSTFQSDLLIQGRLTGSSGITVTGPSTFLDNITMGQHLQVSGNSTFQSAVRIGGDSTVLGNLTVGLHLQAAGNSSFLSGLNITGDLAVSTITGTVNFTGNALVTGSIQGQAITAFGPLNAAGGLTVNMPGSATVLSTGNTNDLSLASTVAYLRLSGPAGGSTLTGIASANGQGRVLFVSNISANNVVLAHATGSVSTNQFSLPGGGNLTLNATDGILLLYDVPGGVWRTMMS